MKTVDFSKIKTAHLLETVKLRKGEKRVQKSPYE